MAMKLKRCIAKKLQKGAAILAADALTTLGRKSRYSGGEIGIDGHRFRYLDGPSFAYTYREIFRRGTYRFRSSSESPTVIDAGANIGLATVYFKTLFPQASVVAFEPDPEVLKVLQWNIAQAKCGDVTVIGKALSNRDGDAEFVAEGADAGRLAQGREKSEAKVPITRLRPYLHSRTDLLKMDIEGAELVVLKDCEDLLHNVQHLFVEYHSFEGEEQRLPELLDLLKRNGFRFYCDQGREVLSPFLETGTYMGMDFVLNIFAKRCDRTA